MWAIMCHFSTPNISDIYNLQTQPHTAYLCGVCGLKYLRERSVGHCYWNKISLLVLHCWKDVIHHFILQSENLHHWEWLIQMWLSRAGLLIAGWWQDPANTLYLNTSFKHGGNELVRWWMYMYIFWNLCVVGWQTWALSILGRILL